MPTPLFPGQITSLRQSRSGPQTLHAFADHGEVAPTLDANLAEAEARQILVDATRTGTALDAVTAELEHEGLQSFCDSYHQLLYCIQDKLGAVAAADR